MKLNWMRMAMAAALAVGLASQSQGASGVWTNLVNANWSVTNNWAGGIMADGAGFTAWFTNAIPGSRTVTVDTNRTIGIVNLGAAGGVGAFTLGPSGAWRLIFNNSGVNAQVNLNGTSNKSDTVSAPMALVDSLDIANDAPLKTLTLSGTITSVVAGARTVANLGAGAAGVLINGIIGNGVGPVGVVQNSAACPLTLGAANTFTNGLIVKAGLVSGTVSATAFGATNSLIILGDSTGSQDATLNGGVAGPFVHRILVAAGNSGMAAISNTVTTTFSGPITLNNHALKVHSSGSSMTLSGGIAGTGTLVLAASAGTTGVTLSSLPVNHTGSITNAGDGPSAATISGGVGSNVTAIAQASTNSALVLSSFLTVASAGTTLANNSPGGAALFTVSGGVRGDGDLILANNSALTNGITLSTLAVTNTGRIVNSGTGSGSTLIRVLIGTNVAGVVQNSASSPLVLAVSNAYFRGTTVDSGILLVSNANGSATGPGAVNINNGGILQGTGSMAGTVTNNHGGVLSPGLDGTPGGTLTMGNLVWKGGGVYTCEIASIANNEFGAGRDYDQIVVTNALTAVPGGSNLVIRLDSLGQTLAFETNRNYSLKVITCGKSAVLNPAEVTLDTNAFLVAGTWLVTNLNNAIYVVYRGDTSPGKNYWRGTGNWSTATNWSLGHAPLAGEDVEFDFLGAANCTADAVSNGLGSVTLAAGYLGAVTFLTTYPDQGPFTNVAIAGDCTINGGALTHPSNSVSEIYRLSLAVGGNLAVNAGGQIQVNGKGYSADQGPGKPIGVSGQQGGAGYGGIGGYDSRSVRPGTTYGSIIAPMNLGSGGGGYYDSWRGPQSGGGSILLAVVGTAVVNGVVSSDGVCYDYNAGSGGSVYLTAAAMSGTGVVRANGGRAPSQYTGGGGRVAVILTNSADSGSVMLQAFAGTGGSRGAGGTVYLESTNHTAGHGKLIVDYNDLAPGNSAMSFTLQNGTTTSSYAFSEMILTNGAIYALDTNDTLDVTGTTQRGDPTDGLDGIRVDGGTLTVPATFGFTNSFITLGTNATFSPASLLNLGAKALLTLNAPLTLGCPVAALPGSALTINAPFTLNALLTVDAGAALTINAAFPTNGPVTLAPAAILTINSPFTLNGPLVVGTGGVTTVNSPFVLNGSLTVEAGGVVTHSANTTNEAFKMTMTVRGDLDVQTNGAITADGKGYVENYGPGKAVAVANASGAGYGGLGAKGTGSALAPTYGSITAPTNCGSGGHDLYGILAYGGGAVRLLVSGTTTVNGAISASGLAGPGVGYYAGGSGGSVFLTAAALTGNGAIRANGSDMTAAAAGGGGRIAVILTNSADFGAVKMQAYTGKGWTAAGLAAPGTVYLESPAQGAGNGLLLIDASNQVAAVTTLISSNVTDTVVGTVVLTNKAVFQIDTNQSLTVNGNWTNAATFIAKTNSTVIFAGAGPATIAGSNTFYNLAITNAGKVVFFEAGKTNLVNGLLKLGSTAPESTVTLQSTTDGSQWFISLASVPNGGTQQIARVTVKDSNAGGGQLLTAAKGSVNAGNNVNWFFPKIGGTVIWVK